MFECDCSGITLHYDNISIELNKINLKLEPGCVLKLGRFESTSWRLQFGWYSWGGNRPMCGWYLVNTTDPKLLKPLQFADLNDVYLVEQ